MPNSGREAIAREVRAELARQRKTQRDVGDVLGLPQSAVWFRLQGGRSFKAEELALVADWLGVPIAQFMPDSERAA